LGWEGERDGVMLHETEEGSNGEGSEEKNEVVPRRKKTKRLTSKSTHIMGM